MSLSDLLRARDEILRFRGELRRLWIQRRDTAIGTEAREVLDALTVPLGKLNALIWKMEAGRC